MKGPRTPTEKLLARLRRRANYWRKRQKQHAGFATNAGDEESTRSANNAWGVEEAIAIVERWAEELGR
jgi:hypothetical protein